VAIYATVEDLEYRLSASYSVPDNALQLLKKASEVIDEVTLGRTVAIWEDTNTDALLKDVITQATCDQVEFWLEVGEEHDVAGLKGSLVAGRLQEHPVPGLVGTRVMRSLLRAGLMWRGVGSI
jgi:hypothetical protein